MDLYPTTDLSFTRHLKAPRTLLWECWTRAEHIPHFFVPRLHRVVACEIDLRVGGRFDTTFEVEGARMENHGVYLEIVEGEKLVFTDAFSEGWKPAPDPFLTAILLLADAEGGGTKYTAIARHRSPEARASHEEMGFFAGWGTVADQLDDYAASLA
jgi:uncharacterized protein YndB with AHSA1/START domain